MQIKFNKFHVAANGIKAKVRYSLDGHCNGRACVWIFANDYSGALGKIFAEYVNATDTQSDYFDKGRVVLFADHPLYAAARVTAEAATAKQRAYFAEVLRKSLAASAARGA